MIFFALGLGCGAEPATAYPVLAGRVVDEADLIGAATEQSIVDRSMALETATGAQLVVVTVATVGTVAIEDFARDLGNSWGIGREGIDDGVLVVVARDDRKVRIAVGDGLAETLTDEEASSIITEHMVPRFTAGDFAGGLEEGTARIDAEVRAGR